MKRSIEHKDIFHEIGLPEASSQNEISGRVPFSGEQLSKNNSGKSRMDPDASLVEAFLLGNDDAFIRLYAKHEVSLFYYCKRMLHNTPAAEDVFQETWARIFELRQRKDHPAIRHFRGLLFHTARNLCWTALHAPNQGESIESSLDVEGSFDKRSEFSVGEVATSTASGHEIEALMVQALARLPFEQRETFVLHEYSGFTYSEIAEMMKVPEPNVKVRAYRARVRLRKFIQGWLGLGEEDDPGDFI